MRSFTNTVVRLSGSHHSLHHVQRKGKIDASNILTIPVVNGTFRGSSIVVHLDEMHGPSKDSSRYVRGASDSIGRGKKSTTPDLHLGMYAVDFSLYQYPSTVDKAVDKLRKALGDLDITPADLLAMLTPSPSSPAILDKAPDAEKTT